MAERFIVEAMLPPETDPAVAARRIADDFGLDPVKVSSLIKRLPDAVTKPIGEREARAVARRFRAAGLVTVVRPEGDPAEIASPTPRRERRTPLPDPDPAPTATPASPPEAAPADGPGPMPPTGDEVEELSAAELEERIARQTGEHPAVPIPEAEAAPAPSPDPDPATEPVAAEPEATAADTPEPAATGPGAVDPDDRQTRTDPGVEVSRTDPGVSATATDPGVAAAPAAAGDVFAPRRRRGSLRAKLLSTAIVPTLLTIVGALAVTWFTARPALYQQLLASARNPAIATAASLSTALEEGGETGDGIDYLRLQETIQITRQAFERQNISFIVATDLEGNPLSGWFAGGDSFTAGTIELQNAIRDQARASIDLGAGGEATSVETGATGDLALPGGNRIEIVSQPLLSAGEPFGAVVVGVTDEAVSAQVIRILINILLFSLIPLAIAILIAVVRSRRLTGNVLTLTRRADEISRGDLEREVTLRSNDELDDLSEALERMRVSMKGALERLRRRRG